MSHSQVPPRLRFHVGFSEQDLYEAQQRGYLSHVLVELGDRRLYPVLFYDIVRLQQDLEESTKHGRPFIADPGMVVLPDISLDAMNQSVQKLYADGFFDHIVAVTEEDIAGSDPLQWPPKPRQR